MAELVVERVVGPGRPLTDEERSILNADAIAEVHNIPRQAFLARVRPDWEVYISRVVREVSAARLGTELRVTVAIPNWIRTAYLMTLREVFLAGQAHVVEELARQRENRKLLADSPGTPPTWKSKVVKKAKVELASAEQKIVAAAAERARAGKLAGLSGAAVRGMVANELSSRVDRDVLGLIDRSVPFVYNEGRAAQAEISKDELSEEVYTAMMDAATCVVCARFDGLRGAVGTFTIPNPDCSGGSLCRCFVYYILKDERGATQEGDVAPFQELANKIGVKKASVLNDVDPIFVDQISKEILDFIGKTGLSGVDNIGLFDGMAAAVHVAESPTGGLNFGLSREIYGSAKKSHDLLVSQQAKGWIPTQIGPDKLHLFPIHRELGILRYEKLKLGMNTDELTQALVEKHAGTLSVLDTGWGAKTIDFYGNLYAVYKTNPAAVTDELFDLLKAIEGQKKLKPAAQPITKKKPLPKKKVAKKPPAPATPVEEEKPWWSGIGLEPSTQPAPGFPATASETIDWGKALSDPELNAVRHYTGGSYSNMRRAALKQRVTDSRFYSKLNADLDAALSRAPKVEGLLFRGTSVPDAVAKQILGRTKTFSFKYHTSTSFSPGTARSFSYSSKPKHTKVFFEIKATGKKGVDVRKVSVQGEGEQEVLFQAGAKFRIVHREVRGGGRDPKYLYVVLEEI